MGKGVLLHGKSRAKFGVSAANFFLLFFVADSANSLHYICSLILHEGNRGLRGDLTNILVV